MSLSARVVMARYLAAAASPKMVLGLIRSYAQRIQTTNDPMTLKRLYSEVAAAARPVALMLDGVTIQRSDEARKLKNLKEWLRVLRIYTDVDKLLSTTPDDELEIAVPMWLERLEETLKSVARVEDRLTGYTQVERVIPHGKYNIVNFHGYRPDEYAEAIKFLDAASDVVTKAGFGHAVYGKVVLESFKPSGYAGTYLDDSDSIRLNLGVRSRYNATYTLVHELGHRVWYKDLTDAQRTAYEDAYYGTAQQVITFKQRQSWFEAFTAAGFEAKRVRVPDQELFKVYLKEVKKRALFPTTAQEWSKQTSQWLTPENLQKIFVLPRQRYYLLDGVKPKSVTDYGQTNVHEDFAEVFAHYCSNMPLTEDARARFHAATGKGA